MRDVIGEMGWGMMGGGYAGRYWRDGVGYDGRGICGTDHLPEIGPAGLPFLVPPPPIHEERETGTANDLRAEKRMLILYLTC